MVSLLTFAHPVSFPEARDPFLVRFFACASLILSRISCFLRCVASRRFLLLAAVSDFEIGSVFTVIFLGRRWMRRMLKSTEPRAVAASLHPRPSCLVYFDYCCCGFCLDPQILLCSI
jgi:hypothetical protein